MPKMTKAEAKRMLQAIRAKTKKVWLSHPQGINYITTADMIAIEKIVNKNLKRLG